MPVQPIIQGVRCKSGARHQFVHMRHERATADARGKHCKRARCSGIAAKCRLCGAERSGRTPEEALQMPVEQERRAAEKRAAAAEAVAAEVLSEYDDESEA